MTYLNKNLTNLVVLLILLFLIPFLIFAQQKLSPPEYKYFVKSPDPTTKKCPDEKNYNLFTLRIPEVKTPDLELPGGIKIPVSKIPFFGTIEKGKDIQMCIHKEDLAAQFEYQKKIKEEIKLESPKGNIIKLEGYETSVKIPCQPGIARGKCPTADTPAGYIARLYQFGLMIAGLVSFGSIIFGGIRYALSAGNTANQQDARDQITQAIIGLVLLLGAYLMLYTINPDLVNLRNPQAEIIDLENFRSTLGGPAGQQRAPSNEEVGNEEVTFCKTSLNTNINISGPKPIAGEKSGSICLQCVEGHTTEEGKYPDCSQCVSGYQKANDGKCIKCPVGLTLDAPTGECKLFSAPQPGSGVLR